MNVAFIIAYSDCHVSHFAEVKMKVVLMIVRGDPTHPDTPRLLPRKDPHRIIILEKEEEEDVVSHKSPNKGALSSVLLPLCCWLQYINLKKFYLFKNIF